jgi:hypothetical protein
MSITSANVTSFVRSIIGEASARYWTDAEITLYVQFAMTKVQSELFYLLWETKKDYAYLPTVSGTSLIDPPADCNKISQIQITSTGDKIKYVSEDEWYKYTYGDAGIDFTDSDFFTAWYMKNLDEVTDFPESCKVLIGIEAAIMARAKNEDSSSDLFILQKDAKLAAMTDLTMANMNQIDAFGDYAESDAIDDSYVWTWKGGKIKIVAV